MIKIEEIKEKMRLRLFWDINPHLKNDAVIVKKKYKSAFKAINPRNNEVLECHGLFFTFLERADMANPDAIRKFCLEHGIKYDEQMMASRHVFTKDQGRTVLGDGDFYEKTDAQIIERLRKEFC